MAAFSRLRRRRMHAVTLFFREKAFWTFGRGQRLNDLRRLMRQYGRTEDKVFPVWRLLQRRDIRPLDPTSRCHRVERVNPLFTGCMDRNP